MKHTHIVPCLAAFSVALLTSLAPSAVYGLNSCPAIFASHEERAKMEAVATKDAADNLKAKRGWAEAAAKGKPSVDPARLQNIRLIGFPESGGIKRLSTTWLKGVFEPTLETETEIGPLFVPKGQSVKYGNRRYVEFPNSTMMTTQDAEGNTRVWVLTRGVRAYKDLINRKNGSISPSNYVSDVLLFEMVDGKPVFRSVYLESAPKKKFLFEDPRISVVPDGLGGVMYLLSGTDYSPHVGRKHNPDRNPDVMNRYVQLKIDPKTGAPLPVIVDAKTGLPDFKDLSPAPVAIDDGGRYQKIDAKNATVSMNEAGEIVVLARLRPESTPEMDRLFDGHKWDYAEQTFIFKNWSEFLAYDRRDLMVDLAGKAGTEKTFGSVRPVVAKQLIEGTQLKEHLRVRDEDRDRLSIVDGEKGLGPGTRPLRIQRVGDLILASDGPGLPMYIHDVILPSERATYPMKNGEVIYAKLDHEIRKIKEVTPTGTLKVRHYSATAKLLSPRMDRITDYLPDVVQPKLLHELGLDSGILDLLHVYPMGTGIVPSHGSKLQAVSREDLDRLAVLREQANKPDAMPITRVHYEEALASLVRKLGKGNVIATAGISDAHTSVWSVNWKILIREAREFTASVSSGAPTGAHHP